MGEIRQFMGVCPQHDVNENIQFSYYFTYQILYDDLTVKEHLFLFASFKGMNDAEIP